MVRYYFEDFFIITGSHVSEEPLERENNFSQNGCYFHILFVSIKSTCEYLRKFHNVTERKKKWLEWIENKWLKNFTVILFFSLGFFESLFIHSEYQFL